MAKLWRNLFKRGDKMDASEVATMENGKIKTVKEHINELNGNLANMAIVESGSNPDGEWARFGNGWQICFHTRDDGEIAFINVGTTWARTAPLFWTYPKPFAVSPSFFPMGGGFDSSQIVSGRTSTNLTGRYRWARMTANATSPADIATDGYISLFAIGRWKH